MQWLRTQCSDPSITVLNCDAAVEKYFKDGQKRAQKAWATMANAALDEILAKKY